MADRLTATLADWVQANATPLQRTPEDFDRLIDRIGDARIVMLGEASHGTAEFYAIRAQITQRLILSKGFNMVAIEGDWPDAARVNRFVTGETEGTVLDSLAGFKRFPTWMWRNTVILDFVAWLREHNAQTPERMTHFYGLDVYSLHSSIAEVLRFLSEVDPEAAAKARERYACFEPFQDTQTYALSAHYLAESCEDQVVENLLELQRRRGDYEKRSSPEAVLDAELNALAALNAERYYRQMVYGGAVTWNLRDHHMVDVLNRLLKHMGPDSKAILWEHNSHIGDFRATYEGRSGHVNVGQLVREQFGDRAFAVGFGTYQGTVTAALEWDGPHSYMRVPPARDHSYEAIFHEAGMDRFFLDLDAPLLGRGGEWLFATREERAIGVVYHPDRERWGNYVPSRLAKRYDAYLFFDETLAVEPLDPFERPGLEAYPEGL
ncbi:Erythromycin esterase [compost metagenome]